MCIVCYLKLIAACPGGPIFKKMNIGTCGFGYHFITSRATCEEAAGALGLANTTAGDVSASRNPFGCYYKLSTERLYWNLAGNKADNDQNRVSLCIEAGICTHMHACLRMVPRHALALALACSSKTTMTHYSGHIQYRWQPATAEQPKVNLWLTPTVSHACMRVRTHAHAHAHAGYKQRATICLPRQCTCPFTSQCACRYTCPCICLDTCPHTCACTCLKTCQKTCLYTCLYTCAYTYL